MDELEGRALNTIVKVILKARTTHGPFPGNTPERASSLLAEECGEVAKEVNDMTRESCWWADPDYTKLKEELLHVSVIAFEWLQYILKAEADNGSKVTDNYSTGGTVGKRSQGDGGSGTVQAKESGPSGADRSSERGAHGVLGRGAAKDATATDRVGEPEYPSRTWGWNVREPGDTGGGNSASEQPIGGGYKEAPVHRSPREPTPFYPSADSEGC